MSQPACFDCPHPITVHHIICCVPDCSCGPGVNTSLLAALEMVVSVFDVRDMTMINLQALADLREPARAAIARARGEGAAAENQAIAL